MAALTVHIQRAHCNFKLPIPDSAAEIETNDSVSNVQSGDEDDVTFALIEDTEDCNVSSAKKARIE